jgi:hypothetical protein
VKTQVCRATDLAAGSLHIFLDLLYKRDNIRDDISQTKTTLQILFRCEDISYLTAASSHLVMSFKETREIRSN